MSKTLDGLHENLTSSIIRSASLIAKERLNMPMTEEEKNKLKEEKFIQAHVVDHLKCLIARPMSKTHTIANFLEKKNES